MNQRRRRSEVEHWLEVREREGLSLRETAERAGIPVGTLSWWTHRLRQERRRRGAGFVEVIPVPDGTIDESVDVHGEAAPCVLRLPSGVVIEARGHIAEQLIERLARSLECS